MRILLLVALLWAGAFVVFLLLAAFAGEDPADIGDADDFEQAVDEALTVGNSGTWTALDELAARRAFWDAQR